MRNWLRNLLAFCMIAAWGIGMSGEIKAQTVATLSNPSGCMLGLPIRDFTCSDNGEFRTPDQFEIEVANAPGTALGIDVFLSEVRFIIYHPWTGDLDIRLISPSGRRVLLSADNGGGNDHYGLPDASDCEGYVTFSANSCLSIKDGAPPFLAGPYLPEESLLSFNDSLTNPNDTWILEICDDAAEDVGKLEFVELVFEPISCLPVETVEVTSVDTTTVTLHWEPSDYCGTTVIEYGFPGFTPGSDSLAGQGTVVIADCPPFRLEGLMEQTTYEVYLRKYCESSGNFSANSCAVRATTGCRPPAPTIIESFDEEATCLPACDGSCPLTGKWRNVAWDNADWIAYSGPTPTEGTGPEDDITGGGNFVYLEATESGTCEPGDTAYLVSNCIRFDKQGTDTCHLSFNYHMQGPGSGALRLEASTDGGFNWFTLWQRSGEQGSDWKKVYLSLSAIPGGVVVQFRFAAVKGAGSKGDIAVDDIVFYGSEDLGTPGRFFYADKDQDGFGNAAVFIQSCADSAPAGYVENGDDCNDDNPEIYPGRPEIACDGVDNNCNGEADDLILPSPLAVHDTICYGETPSICAEPQSDKLIFWYGSPEGDDFLGVVGECYTPVLPENEGPNPVIYRFYAEETDFVCRSGERTEVVVVVNPRPEISVTDQPAVCPGLSFNLAGLQVEDANFTGGTATFHSGTPATNANQLEETTVAPALATTYYVKVTTARGCTDETAVTLDVKPGPATTFSPADSFSLCRESIQRIEVEATGGAGDYRYRWSNGASTPAIEVKAAFQAGQKDVYAVTVTDSEGCFTIDTARVTTTVSITAVRRIIDTVTACTAEDGRLTLEPLDGLPPFRFQWSGSNGIVGDTSGVSGELVIEGLSQGSYRVTITDSSEEACAFLMRSVLINGPNAVIEAPEVTPVSCAGASDGQICLEVDGTNPSFLWSTGDTTSCLENIPGGTYQVTVSEGMCENVLTGIIVEEPAPLRVQIDRQMPSCNDASDGSVTVVAFGGNGNYQYRWSTGAVGAALTGVQAGTYVLTTTDAGSCLRVDTVELGAPAPLSIQALERQDISCYGEADGRLLVSARGGTAPYQYDWSTESTAPLVFELAPGTYSVTVTDFNGCVQSREWQIEEPPPLTVDLAERNLPLCVGDFTGSIRVLVDGGTPAYTYRWDAGFTDSLLTNLGVGRYELQVEDANGCRSDTLAVELPAFSSLDLEIAVQEPECLGASNGSIALQPEGEGPFQYQWEDGGGGSILSGIGVGEYSVTIQDGRGCLYDTSVVVEAPQEFEVNFSLLPPSCNGSEDGVINPVIISGGTPPVSYEWSNGHTTASLFGVGAGTYQVTLTDVRNCRFVSDTLEVADPPPLTASVAGLGQINCKGDSTGFIELAVEGGVPPYTYNWLNIDAAGSAVFDLTAGQYQVQILDAINCPLDMSIALPEPPELVVAVEVESSDVCQGNGETMVRAAASGGVTPYQYQWSTGVEDSLLQNPAPGAYALTVSDAGNCEEIIPSVKVRELPQPLRLDSFQVRDISCNGAQDGEMIATIEGGMPPYRYHFSNNQIVVTNSTTVRRSNLPAGSGYNVTITDLSTGCVVISERKPVREPAVLSGKIDKIDPVDCFGGSDGAIFASVVGGMSPYRFNWRDVAGQVVGTFDSLRQIGAGQYTGVVVDDNECTDTLPVVELVALYPPLERIDSLMVVKNAKCKNGHTGSIDITLSGGAPPYAYEWSNGANTQDIDGLSAGSYSLTVTDSKNCRSVLVPVMVGEPEEAIIVSGSGEDVSCFGGNDGSVSVGIRGGIPPYKLQWIMGGDTIAEHITRLDSIRAGRYLLQAEDEAGCLKSFPFNVEQPDSLAVAIEIIAPVETMPGRAVARVTGGTPGYNYLWNTGARSSSIDTLREDRYNVTVTDRNGCMATDVVFLTDIYKAEIVEQAVLYPNPSRGVFSLKVDLRRRAELQMRVFDEQGRLVHYEDLGAVQTEHFQWNRKRWSPGIYRLVLYNGASPVYAGQLLIVN